MYLHFLSTHSSHSYDNYVAYTVAFSRDDHWVNFDAFPSIVFMYVTLFCSRFCRTGI